MWLAICGDPDCPNKRTVEELERKIREMEHPVKIGRKSVENLAEEVGNLRYDALERFLLALSDKLNKDGQKDKVVDRNKLAKRLQAAAVLLGHASNEVAVAWFISQPYMNGK